LLASGDWVAEGRDNGRVLAPPAELKRFLPADPPARARRRARETGRPVGEVLAEQAERDARDGEREISPLRPADDAVELDTSGLAVDEVCRQVEALVAQRRGPGDGQ
ncbi:MAG: (d)CMP kinase, partial [Solirubrobacterales bacterium]